MKLPSKELLSAVLSEDIASVDVVGNTVNYTVLNYVAEEDGELIYIDLGTNINIYELMHLMKMWAWARYGVVVVSAIAKLDDSLSFTFARAKIQYWDMDDPVESEHFTAESEFEAVTQACEWSLKQGGTK